MYLENYTQNDILVDGHIWVKESQSADIGFGNKNANISQYDSNGGGAGGLHATSEDMAKFLLFRQTGEYNGTRLLSEESIKLMQTNQGPELSYFHDGEYGLGWMLGEKDFFILDKAIRIKTQGHGGNTPYYWGFMENTNQIFANGSINNNTIGIVLIVNQGYNLREGTDDPDFNFAQILDYIENFAYLKFVPSIEDSGFQTSTVVTTTSSGSTIDSDTITTSTSTTTISITTSMEETTTKMSSNGESSTDGFLILPLMLVMIIFSIFKSKFKLKKL